MRALILLCTVIILVYLIIPKYRHPLLFHNFVSPDERHYIMDKARKVLKPSTVSTDNTIKRDVRQSETAWLSLEDPKVRAIVERCLAMTDRPIDNCENLQVLRYEEGGFYKPHQDSIDGLDNKRMYTFIIALNDGYQGGATVFPNIDRSYRLKAGDVLFFDTLDNYELITSKALHGGMPVNGGEKWICNLWVNKYPLTTKT